jgi:hypothetical protein
MGPPGAVGTLGPPRVLINPETVFVYGLVFADGCPPDTHIAVCWASDFPLYRELPRF